MQNLLDRLKKVARNPYKYLRTCVLKIFMLLGGFINDKTYIKIWYFLVNAKKLDLNNPKTYNEKLQWLKLYDRNPLYTTLVDKVKVKEYIANKIGEEYLIPTIGVWNSPEEIDFDSLPNRFVLKCNHNSGTGMFICKDKSKVTKEKWSLVKKDLLKGLKEDYFLGKREWPYKNVPRKILAEKYMVDESGVELKDYKIFNFNGKPQFVEVDFDRFINHKRNIYTTDWEYIDMEIQYKSYSSYQIPKPKCLNKMLEIAKILSVGIPHVRTDFYVINNRIYFGEMTFFHESGIGEFRPEQWNYKFGELLVLPKSKI